MRSDCVHGPIWCAVVRKRRNNGQPIRTWTPILPPNWPAIRPAQTSGHVECQNGHSRGCAAGMLAFTSPHANKWPQPVLACSGDPLDGPPPSGQGPRCTRPCGAPAPAGLPSRPGGDPPPPRTDGGRAGPGRARRRRRRASGWPGDSHRPPRDHRRCSIRSPGRARRGRGSPRPGHRAGAGGRGGGHRRCCRMLGDRGHERRSPAGRSRLLPQPWIRGAPAPLPQATAARIWSVISSGVRPSVWTMRSATSP